MADRVTILNDLRRQRLSGLASMVTEARAELMYLILGEATRHGGRRTVALDLLVDALLERLGVALESGDWKALTSFIEANRSTTARSPAMRAALRALIPAVEAVVRGRRGMAGSVVRDLHVAEATIERALQTPHALARASTAGSDAAVDALIDTLVGELACSNPAAADDLRAVSAWSARIAQRLGSGREESAFIARCGLLHDIGKIATPREILLASRPLAEHERSIVRQHIERGVEIVSEFPELHPFLDGVLAHHERFDGTGYPQGLAGTAIPLAARVVAVAGAFHAMIGRRPYREPLSPAAALAELRRDRGTQFDPEIVDAMTHVVIGRRAKPPPS